MLFTSLADNKYIILQKLANVFERPVAEQIEVFTAVFLPEEQMHRVDLIYYEMSNILWKINGLLWHFYLSYIMFLRAGFE